MEWWCSPSETQIFVNFKSVLRLNSCLTLSKQYKTTNSTELSSVRV